MTRTLPARCAPALLGVLAVLLGACTADSPSTGSSSRGESDSARPAESGDPEPTALVFDPDEPTLPGGVRVLSRTIDGAVTVTAGRYGVRISDSLLYQVEVSQDTEVVAGTYLSPRSSGEGGLNGIMWIDEAGDDTALPVHPCRDHTAQPVGPTVADLATALSTQPFLTVTAPVEVTVGGMNGLLVEATVPDDADMFTCQDRAVDLISGHHSAGPGNVQRIWILDVDGTRHVINAKVSTGADDTQARQHTRAMTRMVESITFTHS